MWSVPSTTTTTPSLIVLPSLSSSCFFKDGREISVGECALFKLAQDSPPLVGIIRSLTSDKQASLTLRVSWLYRPAEVKLSKGVVLEATPNEVFYSFHRDEIPAASFLHRCKVAFLSKGAELPAGISSFVCRRVYDITNSCLWWLTDQDYIDERQEEVDQLLHKTLIEMHASVERQQGPCSPKPVDGSVATSPPKHSLDSVQSSGSNIPSQKKGKKRHQGDQRSEPIKREQTARIDDCESGHLRSDSLRNLETAKLTEKGGLVNTEAVARLVRLMQPEKSRRKLDLRERSLLAGAIAATDKHDCLSQFVQLKGIPVLDEWLQEVHKGKFGEFGGEKAVEDFLLVLLSALEKLPVNLNALQMCRIGKSVNHLRSHKNPDIQKRARSLVDTWKKRVKAEMNITDSKSGSAQTVPGPGRIRDDSHSGNRLSVKSSEPAIRCAASHQSTSKLSSVKHIQGESNSKAASSHQSNVRSALSLASTTFNCKDAQSRTTDGGSFEPPQLVVGEEKSSGSSQSNTNSQCSSDHVRNLAPSGKVEAGSSSAASKSLYKSSGGGSRHNNSANGSIAGVSKDSTSYRSSPVARSSNDVKVSHNAVDGSIHEENNKKLIVKISNRGRGPAHSFVEAFIDDLSGEFSRTSSPAVSEKHDPSKACLKRKHDSHQLSEVDGSSAAVLPRPSDSIRIPNVSKSVYSPARNEMKSRKPHDSSFSSMNALVESCVKLSEANSVMSDGDDIGMNLLASVAAEEISRAISVSPAAPPHKSSEIAENSGIKDIGNEKGLHDDVVNKEGQLTNVVSNDDCNISSCAPKVYDEESTKHSVTAEDVPQNEDGCLRKNGVSDEQVHAACTAGRNVSDVGAKVSSEKVEDLTGYNQPSVASLTVGSHVESEDKVKNASVNDEPLKKSYKDVMCASVDGENDRKFSVCTSPKKDCSVELYPAVAPLLSESLNKDEMPAGQHPDAIYSTIKSEKAAGADKCEEVKGRLDREDGSSEMFVNQEDPVVRSAIVTPETVCKVDNLDNKEAVVQPSGDSGIQVGCSEHILPEEMRSSAKEANMIAVDVATKKVGAAVAVGAVSSPATGGLGVDAKLGFDLNEGFSSDDGNCAEAFIACPVDCPLNSLQVPVSSTSGGSPLLDNVTALGKEPFIPHNDLLRNSDLGWKGSAAKSAFHPAEPRKVVKVVQGASKALHPDNAASVKARLPLDIDLNVADNSCEESNSIYESVSELITSTCLRGSRGLDLDLNKADEASDVLQKSASDNQRRDSSTLAVKPLSSSIFLNGGASCRRDFDLNDGPATEEMAIEQIAHSQAARNNIPFQRALGPRISTSDAGNLFPWYPPGTSYSVSMAPSTLHERQAFPVVGMGGGAHRIMGGPTSNLSLNPEAFRGSVLSSSPAMPFQSAAFQYPVFPVGTSFPLPTAAWAGGPSGYVDATGTGRIPGFPSQLTGNATAVPFQYPHAYIFSRPHISNNAAVENNQKCGERGVDLNSGPGCLDLEYRNQSLPAVPRQVSIISSQPLVDEQTRMCAVGGGTLKRKEPEGGWSIDKFSSKESRWR